MPLAGIQPDEGTPVTLNAEALEVAVVVAVEFAASMTAAIEGEESEADEDEVELAV